MNKVSGMSKNAQTVLDEIRSLPLAEQREVLEALERPPAPAAPKRESHRRGRGLFAGSGLLEALLAERAKERARG
jgi:hypothetical protein